MKVRRIVVSDWPMIAEWASRDPFHEFLRTRHVFFTDPQSLNLCFEDGEGPVFFTKLAVEGTDIRVFIQFNQGTEFRTARMLKRGFDTVLAACRQSKAKRLVFDSVYEPLIQFCINQFGFERVPESNDLELKLDVFQRPAEPNRGVSAAVL